MPMPLPYGARETDDPAMIRALAEIEREFDGRRSAAHRAALPGRMEAEAAMLEAGQPIPNGEGGFKQPVAGTAEKWAPRLREKAAELRRADQLERGLREVRRRVSADWSRRSVIDAIDETLDGAMFEGVA